MNIFSKNLIIAVAGAMLLLATGCTKKPSRPTPDLTVINPGADAYTGASSVTDGANANQYPYGTSGMQYTTNAPVVTELTSKQMPDDKGQIRNVAELQPIYFGFDRSAIEQKERSKFQAIKDYLAKNPQYRILFEGHCDWRGTAEYNMALGDRRANAAKKYAASIGIDPGKIDVVSKGSTEATERASEEVMAKDRRAEIVVLAR
jgi:peptidoglycan-associated lipoprotein